MGRRSLRARAFVAFWQRELTLFSLGRAEGGELVRPQASGPSLAACGTDVVWLPNDSKAVPTFVLGGRGGTVGAAVLSFDIGLRLAAGRLLQRACGHCHRLPDGDLVECYSAARRYFGPGSRPICSNSPLCFRDRHFLCFVDSNRNAALCFWGDEKLSDDPEGPSLKHYSRRMGLVVNDLRGLAWCRLTALPS